VKSKGINIKIYKHQYYTRTIDDTFNYLKSNLDMLRFDIGRTIFKEDSPIYSKEKTAPPTKYLGNAFIENAMISSGSIINGTVINSVVGRDVIVKKGALIKNSYVMSNCVIEEDVSIDFAILDKQTIVKKETILEGTLRNPFVTQKEQIVNHYDNLRVLLVASESYPFIKTGGLADVLGSLSRNLARKGIDTTVVLPYYKKIKKEFESVIKSEFTKTIIYDQERYKVRIYSLTYKKVKYYFIDNFDFFDFDEVYGLENDTDRFAFFSKAVVELLDDLNTFDLIHIHDWHTSLIPSLLENSKHKGTNTLLTIHNIEYQGQADKDIMGKVGITDFIHKDDYINFLEIGINTASKLSTVSPTYKEELKYEYYGKNLTYSLFKRERDFYGILNGISSSFNPEKDKSLRKTYSVNTFEDKYENKKYLQEKMGIHVGKEKFVIGVVSRIVEQKGFDLILQSFDSILENKDIQFVLLGAGNELYITELLKLEAKYPNQVKMNIGYDATNPNYIYAGADVFLMPSRFEPCGLGQMIALKYGTLPIVRKTGGLNDTITKYDALTNKGNGFTFGNYDADEMKEVIESAYNLFKTNKKSWNILIKRAMKSDNSLDKSTRKYIELYKMITEN